MIRVGLGLRVIIQRAKMSYGCDDRNGSKLWSLRTVVELDIHGLADRVQQNVIRVTNGMPHGEAFQTSVLDVLALSS